MKYFTILLFLNAAVPAVAWPIVDNTCWVSAYRCASNPRRSWFDDPRTLDCCNHIGHSMCDCGNKKQGRYCDGVGSPWIDHFEKCCAPFPAFSISPVEGCSSYPLLSNSTSDIWDGLPGTSETTAHKRHQEITST
ncbi:hypothetical protein TUN199_04601 [Pyrenophora tritici-repentis]|nr:hypothetical protein Alg130_05885 [Pyrenophora tritici-repentis]KAI0607527.1 hypothetical protein TUN205_08217 [Pyrenophora tritici-repentis]KAI0623410.1 hypothetical protein TUN199_04601 [Pyrenophora tritici-repentis]